MCLIQRLGCPRGVQFQPFLWGWLKHATSLFEPEAPCAPGAGTSLVPCAGPSLQNLRTIVLTSITVEAFAFKNKQPTGQNVIWMPASFGPPDPPRIPGISLLSFAVTPGHSPVASLQTHSRPQSTVCLSIHRSVDISGLKRIMPPKYCRTGVCVPVFLPLSVNVQE